MHVSSLSCYWLELKIWLQVLQWLGWWRKVANSLGCILQALHADSLNPLCARSVG